MAASSTTTELLLQARLSAREQPAAARRALQKLNPAELSEAEQHEGLSLLATLGDWATVQRWIPPASLEPGDHPTRLRLGLLSLLSLQGLGAFQRQLQALLQPGITPSLRAMAWSLSQDLRRPMRPRALLILLSLQLQLEPESHQLLLLQARALDHLQQHEAAERVWAQLYRMRPQIPLVSLRLGAVRLQLGRRRGALEVLRQLPSEAIDEERLQQARLLSQAGDALGAAEHYRGILSAREEPRLRMELAQCLERGHQLEEALEVLAPLPDRLMGAQMLRAQLLRRLGRLQEGLDALDLCQPPRPPGRARLLHLQGQLLEGLGAWERSFQHYQRSRALLKELLPWNEAAYRAKVQAALTAPRPPLSEEDSGPALLLVVGMPRSGSSLTEQMLHAHPQIRALGETAQLDRLALQLRQQCGGAPLGPWLAALPLERRQTIRQRLLTALELGEGSEDWLVEKTPSGLFHLGWIGQLLPRSRALICQRAPLHNAFSCWTTPFDQGHRWALDWEALARVSGWHQQLSLEAEARGPIPVLRSAYEDLVQSPEPSLRRILEFLELPWAEDCLSPQRITRSVVTASYAQVREPLHGRSLARARPYRPWLGPLIQALERQGLSLGD